MSDLSEIRSYADLLQQYLLVCNQVLQQNGTRFPFCHIWQAGEAALSGQSVEFAVVDDEPKAFCRVTLLQNKIKSDTTTRGTKSQPPVMRLSTRYLHDVVSNPQKYIENPALIDWGWLSPTQQTSNTTDQ